MAQPVYVGMATPQLGLGDGTVTLQYPADVQPNDLLIAFILVVGDVGDTITAYNSTSDFPDTIASTSVGVRRGVTAASRVATGYEGTGGTVFGVTTTLESAVVSGTVFNIRGALTASGIHAGVSMGMTSSGLAAPGDVTTSDTDESLFSLIAYRNTDTITDISANGWVQGEAVQNDTVNSFNLQYLWVPAAATISGGAATLGTSGIWGTITFAVKPVYPSGTDIYSQPATLVQVG